MKLLPKVAWMVLASSGAMLVLSVTLQLQNVGRELERRAYESLHAEVSGVLPVLGRALWNFDREVSRAALSAFSFRREVRSVTLWDETGKLLEQYQPAGSQVTEAHRRELSARILTQVLPDAGRSPRRTVVRSQMADFCCGNDGTEFVVGTLWSSEPERLPAFLGHVVVEVAPEVLSEVIRSGQARIVAVSALVEFLALGVLAFFLRHSLIRPIERLALAAHSASIDRLDLVPELKGNDEPAMLTRSFNAMILRLRSQRQILQDREEDLRKAIDAAQAASRAKSAFLANMSHEIRTPMNGIVGMSELLARGELSDKQREYVRIILNSADSLTAVINNVLDISKIESGKLCVTREAVAVAELARQVVDTFHVAAMDKGLEISCETSDGLMPLYYGDRNKIRQILMNLVNNAVKFTERGSIRLCVEEQFPRTHVAWIRFSVTDTGIGVVPELQEKIFEEFSQIDGTLTRKYHGTGLGLAISRRFAEAMGGHLEVESAEGCGSRFTLSVPLETAAKPLT